MNTIEELFETNSIKEWEETSLDYCKCETIGMLGGGEAVLIYEADEELLDSVKSYLEKYHIIVQMMISKKELNSKTIDRIEQTGYFIVLLSDLIPYRRKRIYRKIDEYILYRVQYEFIKRNKSKMINIRIPYWMNRRIEIRDYVKKNISNFNTLIEQLADNESKETLLEILRCSVEGDIYKKPEKGSYYKYWECYRHIDNEVWVNCGSAYGDTIIQYIKNGYHYNKILAFEGDKDIYDDMCTVVSRLGVKRIETINEYIGTKKENGFDERFADMPITLINMDIEGAEMGVLRGASEIIRKYRPVLAICAYHKATDLIEIPSVVSDVEGYNIYLRKYCGYEPNSLNEYVYYLVPNERKLV